MATTPTTTTTTTWAPRRAGAARRPRPPGYASQLAFVATGLIPILAMFAVFAFLPIGVVLWLSLHRYNQLAPTAPFIGLGNFTFAFTKDPFFLGALATTLKYALVAVPVNLAFALPIALGLNAVPRLRAVFRSAFFLPTVASAVAVSLSGATSTSRSRAGSTRRSAPSGCRSAPGWPSRRPPSGR
jgi:ABC-type sugar transport system permease subunit